MSRETGEVPVMTDRWDDLRWRVGRQQTVKSAAVADLLAERDRLAAEVAQVPPGSIVSHPAWQTGRPRIPGHRIPAETIANFVMCDGMEATLDSYGITRAEALGACRFQAVEAEDRTFEGWVQWAWDHHRAMVDGDWDNVPNPPGVKP